LINVPSIREAQLFFLFSTKAIKPLNIPLIHQIPQPQKGWVWVTQPFQEHHENPFAGKKLRKGWGL
jgi:hypothetical protein